MAESMWAPGAEWTFTDSCRTKTISCSIRLVRRNWKQRLVIENEKGIVLLAKKLNCRKQAIALKTPIDRSMSRVSLSFHHTQLFLSGCAGLTRGPIRDWEDPGSVPLDHR